MEPGEALSTAAQIAVTLAGFAGVVVVFRRESVHEWSPIDILPLGPCVTAILLLAIEPTLTGVWRWCGVCSFFGIRDRGKHEFSPPETTAVTRDGRQFHLLSIRDSRVGINSLAVV